MVYIYLAMGVNNWFGVMGNYKIVSVSDVLDMFGDYLTPEQTKEVELLVLNAKRDNDNGNVILLLNESGVRLYIESGKSK